MQFIEDGAVPLPKLSDYVKGVKAALVELQQELAQLRTAAGTT